MPDLGAVDLILGFLLLITPVVFIHELGHYWVCLLYTSPSPRDRTRSRMPSSA